MVTVIEYLRKVNDIEEYYDQNKQIQNILQHLWIYFGFNTKIV